MARAPIDALRPRRLRRRRPLRFRQALPGGTFGDIFRERPLGGRFRAVRRMLMVLLWTLVAIPIQAVLHQFPGRAKVGFGRFYHATLCRLIGLRVQVIGELATERGGSAGRPVLFLSNHSSWLDILVLGGAHRRLLRVQGRGGELAADQHRGEARPHGLRQPQPAVDGARGGCDARRTWRRARA